MAQISHVRLPVMFALMIYTEANGIKMQFENMHPQSAHVSSSRGWCWWWGPHIYNCFMSRQDEAHLKTALMLFGLRKYRPGSISLNTPVQQTATMFSSVIISCNMATPED